MPIFYNTPLSPLLSLYIYVQYNAHIITHDFTPSHHFPREMLTIHDFSINPLGICVDGTISPCTLFPVLLKLNLCVILAILLQVDPARSLEKPASEPRSGEWKIFFFLLVLKGGLFFIRTAVYTAETSSTVARTLLYTVTIHWFKRKENFLIYKEIQQLQSNIWLTASTYIYWLNICAFPHILGSPSSHMTL